MNIYLDIDGVILANDKQSALHAEQFIKHVVENHTVYWLTTHCRNPGDDPVPTLESFFTEPTVTCLKQIKPTYWDTLKTEAIDFSLPFRWIDDDCLESERDVLQQYGVFDSWVEVNLAKDPHQLRNLLF